jgi:tripartite-type tricarboxylate transporter receptor subunit TctC
MQGRSNREESMLTRRNLLAAGAGAGAAALTQTWHAYAQGAYPTAPIRFISMFPPGAGADVKIRFYASLLTDMTGHKTIVENRPGAFGNIATEAAARSKPDGHTVYICPSSSMLVANRYIFRKLNFDPLNDFEHITTLQVFAFTLVVRSDRFKSVSDLTEFLKKQGDKASYGSLAAPGFVSAEIYKAKFGLKTVEVKYKDQNAMSNDLLNGSIDFAFVDLISVAAHVREGKLKGLCMASAEPLKNVPGIPGAREAGIPDLDIRNFWSVHVPAKTPKPICDQLEKWFNEIAVAPKTLEFNARTGADELVGNSKMLRELLERETRNWAQYAKIANIKPI